MYPTVKPRNVFVFILNFKHDIERNAFVVNSNQFGTW